MNTLDDWTAAIAAAPRDVNLRLAFADWLDENPVAWRHPTCEICGKLANNGGEVGTGGPARPISRHVADLTSADSVKAYQPTFSYCYPVDKKGECLRCHGWGYIDLSALPPHQQPPWEQHRYAMALRWEDERAHGTEKCKRLCPKCGNSRHNRRPDWSRCDCWEGPCSTCHDTLTVPTFSLLLDHPGEGVCEECGGSGKIIPEAVKRMPLNHVYAPGWAEDCPACSGTGRAVVLGTLSTLIAELRYGGDPLAEELAGLHIAHGYPRAQMDLPDGQYWVEPTGQVTTYYRNRLDALRELHSRVWRAMTEECKAVLDHGHTLCPQCHGLGWRVRMANENRTTP